MNEDDKKDDQNRERETQRRLAPPPGPRYVTPCYERQDSIVLSSNRRQSLRLVRVPGHSFGALSQVLYELSGHRQVVFCFCSLFRETLFVNNKPPP